MTFAELVRLLRVDGFELRRQKGSKHFYGKAGFPGLIQVDFMARKKSHPERSVRSSKTRASRGEAALGPCGLPFSIEIEETQDRHLYGVTVPEILGCTTTGRSIEDAIAQAREAIALHLQYLAEEGLPVPRPRPPVEIRIVRRAEDVAA